MSDHLPKTCLPTWSVAELPEPSPLTGRNLAALIGPGIVMCGIQIGGGEWLFGPAITAKYGGGLMWIATVAIVLQVFYNLECGRYALYTGESVFTGFMRTRPGPGFWVGAAILMSLSALIPGLSTNAAVSLATLMLRRVPTDADAFLVNTIAYISLGAVVLPVLMGGKVYNMLQWVMTAKVVTVLGFCLAVGIFCVDWKNWMYVFSGFVKFGNIPVTDSEGQEVVLNIFSQLANSGPWPTIALGSVALLGAFAGYAGGGGLSNSTYSNFVRDKGWGMGSQVGAIPSAVGGRHITLSHIGSVFIISKDSLRRWRGWWQYILSDQLLVWMPGCFMGMALPALLSMEFARYSPMYGKTVTYSQSLIVADGMRHSPNLGEWGTFLSVVCLLIGLIVFLPSQMSVVDDIARRWTDIIWSSNASVRERWPTDKVWIIYYAILGTYVVWSYLMATVFLMFGDAPTLMVTVIANLNNVALGLTAFHILWINRRYLPAELRPRWYHQCGIAGCGVFYLGLAVIVFIAKVWPLMKDAM